MKKILFIIAFSAITQFSYSQVFVEEKNINELDLKYIELVGINTSLFGVKMQVYVDYGQSAKFMKSEKIKDSNGEKIKFNSMMHALNFMNKNGWEYVNYSENVIGGKMRYVYLLKKKKILKKNQMKKIITLSVLLLISVITTNAQQLSEGNSMINLGMGLSSYFTSGSGYNTSIPPVEGTYEYMVTENISAGIFVGAYGSKYETNYELANNFSSKFNYVHGGALGNYHFVNDDKFNAYAGLKLGYLNVSTSTDSNDDYLDELLETMDYTDSGLLFGVQIGGRYFISENIAINAELGYGITVLKIGVTFKI